jgi:hypothetical protein
LGRQTPPRKNLVLSPQEMCERPNSLEDKRSSLVPVFSH